MRKLQMIFHHPLFKKISQVFVGKILTAGASFVLIVVLTSHFELSEFGMYVYFTSVCVIIAMVSNWGTNEYLFRKCSTDISSVSSLLRATCLWKLFLAFVLGLGFLFFLSVGNWRKTEVFVAVFLMASSILDAQSMSYIMIRRASGDNKTEALFFPIRSLSKLAAVSLVLFNTSSLLYVAIVICAINAVGLVILWGGYSFWVRTKVQYNCDQISFKKLIKVATPYAIFGVIGALYSQNAAIFLNLLAGQEVVAIYGVGIQFYQVAIFLPVAVNIAIQPTLSKTYESDREKWRSHVLTIYKYLLPISIMTGLFLYWFLPIVLKLAFDERYILATNVIEVFMLAFIFRFISSSLIGSSMISANKISYYNYVLVGALFVNMLANILLIPEYHEMGAALSFLISEIVIFIVGSLLLFYVTTKNKKHCEK